MAKLEIEAKLLDVTPKKMVEVLTPPAAYLVSDERWEELILKLGTKEKESVQRRGWLTQEVAKDVTSFVIPKSRTLEVVDA